MAEYLFKVRPAPRLTSMQPPAPNPRPRVTSRLEAAAVLITQANCIARGAPIPPWAKDVGWRK